MSCPRLALRAKSSFASLGSHKAPVVQATGYVWTEAVSAGKEKVAIILKLFISNQKEYQQLPAYGFFRN